MIKIIALYLIFLMHVNAYSSFCSDNKLGWKFYCDTPVKRKPIIEKKETERNSKISYSSELKELQKEADESKAKAVLYPTEQNIKDYITLQAKIIEQASIFSDLWRRVIWSNPELDYTSQRPVSMAGGAVYKNEKEIKVDSTIKNMNERYGIFFIYSSTCPFCQRYSSILDSFRKKYKVTIVGVSIDRDFLPEFKNESLINRGHLEKMGVNYSTVPVTVLFDKTNNSILPIGYGLMTEDELINRIYVLTQVGVGEDY
ncbi:MAG: conjugal transfer protein TraF [Rickettsiales bacterium]|jgi:conjugal transfer pilus assembly protein TraF|nr:conjugal transfer protein TraF [Rickettsiales bacterium]